MNGSLKILMGAWFIIFFFTGGLSSLLSAFPVFGYMWLGFPVFMVFSGVIDIIGSRPYDYDKERRKQAQENLKAYCQKNNCSVEVAALLDEKAAKWARDAKR